MFSIVIPAHNEEKLLTKSLKYLLADNDLKNCELIVVCNGCSDGTVDSVTQFDTDFSSELSEKQISLLIIDEAKASKTNAINIGTNKSQFDTCILLDADILVRGNDLNQLIKVLSEQDLHAASPKLCFNYQNSSFWVRQYFELVKYSNYNQNHRLSNVIALSKKGLTKLGQLPEVIADDEYIRRQFKSSEYAIIPSLSFDFICPKTIKNLIQVMKRVERGNLQLAQLNYSDKSGSTLSGFARYPILSLPVFLLVKLYSVWLAKKQLKQGKITQWERDDSNR